MTLVVSPHLDDAALGAFVDLARGARVANVCTALPEEGVLVPWDKICGASSSREMLARRVEEDRAALASIGVEPTNLDYLQASYRDGAPVDAGELASRLLAASEPGERVLLPLGGGPRPHPDHVLVRSTSLALAAAGRRVVLYGDFPHAVKGGCWPAWISGNDADEEAPWWRRFPRAAPGMVDRFSVQVRRLGEAEATRKLDLMKRYETQFRALDRGLRKKGLVAAGLWKIEPVWELDLP